MSVTRSAAQKYGAWTAAIVVAIVGFAVHQSDIDANRRLISEVRVDEVQLNVVVQQLALSERRLVAVEVGACASRNRVVTGITGFVGDSIVRSKRTYLATAADPTSTNQQRRSSFANYASLVYASIELRARLPLEQCKPTKGTTR